MFVEIYGAGFHNKGAQLMLYTAAHRLRRAEGALRCCVERRGTYEERAAYGLLTLCPGHVTSESPLRKRVGNAGFRRALKLLPASFRWDYGLVLPDEPSALIDVSGYAFGDKWGTSGFRRFTARAAQYRRQGRPVVMLPQMLGPFDKPGYADLFKRLHDEIDLLYARDRVSLEHARAVVPGSTKIDLAPDITIFTEVAEAAVADKPYMCLIPNTRMTDQGKTSWGDKYLDLLVAAAKAADQQGYRVHILIHEASEGDVALGHELLALLGPDASCLVEQPDPLWIKRHIAGAAFIISSRFHSIVGALATGVAPITLGWAHKYETILEDFGARELVCDPSITPVELEQKVLAVATEQSRAGYRARFTAKKEEMRSLNQIMWNRVFAILRR